MLFRVQLFPYDTLHSLATSNSKQNFENSNQNANSCFPSISAAAELKRYHNFEHRFEPSEQTK